MAVHRHTYRPVKFSTVDNNVLRMTENKLIQHFLNCLHEGQCMYNRLWKDVRFRSIEKSDAESTLLLLTMLAVIG